MEKIGSLKNSKIEREFYRQGRIYKDFNAFEERNENVCYIPELSDLKYTYNDFLRLAMEYLSENNELKSTPAELAKALFEAVDWQHPETLLDEWKIAGDIIK